MEYVDCYVNSYIGTGDWAEFYDKVIAWRTGGDETHSEFEFEDGISFSSSIRKDPSTKKSEGVRFKRIDYNEHPERWKKHLLILPKHIAFNIRRRAEVLAALELKYDKRAIAGFLITGRHNPWAFYCSEVVYGIMASDLLLPVLNYKMDPHKLDWVAAKISAQLIKEARDDE